MVEASKRKQASVRRETAKPWAFTRTHLWDKRIMLSANAKLRKTIDHVNNQKGASGIGFGVKIHMPATYECLSNIELSGSHYLTLQTNIKNAL